MPSRSNIGNTLGPELDAVADDAELRRLLDQAHAEALARERKRARLPRRRPPPTTRIGSKLRVTAAPQITK